MGYRPCAPPSAYFPGTRWTSGHAQTRQGTSLLVLGVGDAANESWPAKKR